MSNLAALEQLLTAAVTAAAAARQSSAGGSGQLSRIPSASDLSDQLRERLKHQQLQELQELQRQHLQQVTQHRQLLLQYQKEQLIQERQARFLGEQQQQQQQQRLAIAPVAQTQYTDADGDDEDDGDDDAATEEDEDPRSALHRTPTPTPSTLRQQQQQQQQQQQRPPRPPSSTPPAISQTQASLHQQQRQQQAQRPSPTPPPPPPAAASRRSSSSSLAPAPIQKSSSRTEPRPLQPRPQPVDHRLSTLVEALSSTAKLESGSNNTLSNKISHHQPSHQENHHHGLMDQSSAETLLRPSSSSSSSKQVAKRKDKLPTVPLPLPLPPNIDGLPDFENLPPDGSGKKPKRRYRKTILRQQAQWLAAQISAENERRDAEGRKRILNRLRFAQHSRQLRTRLEFARYKLEHELQEQPIHIAEELLDDELEELRLHRLDESDSDDFAANQPPSPSAGRTPAGRRSTTTTATMASVVSALTQDTTESDTDTPAALKRAEQKKTTTASTRQQPKGVRYYKTVVTDKGRRQIVRVHQPTKRPTGQDSQLPAVHAAPTPTSNHATPAKPLATTAQSVKKQGNDKTLVDLSTLPHAQEELKAQQDRALKELQRHQLEQLEELKRLQLQQQEELKRVMAETAAELEMTIKKRAGLGQVTATAAAGAADKKQSSHQQKALSLDKENIQPPLQATPSSSALLPRSAHPPKALGSSQRPGLVRAVSTLSHAGQQQQQPQPQPQQQQQQRRTQHVGREESVSKSVSRLPPTPSKNLSRHNATLEGTPAASLASVSSSAPMEKHEPLLSPQTLQSKSPVRPTLARGLDRQVALSKSQEGGLAMRQQAVTARPPTSSSSSSSSSSNGVYSQETGSQPSALMSAKKKKPLNPIQKTSSTENILASARHSQLHRGSTIAAPASYTRETTLGGVPSSHSNNNSSSSSSGKRNASAVEDKENVEPSSTSSQSGADLRQTLKSQKHLPPQPETKQAKRSKQVASSDEPELALFTGPLSIAAPMDGGIDAALAMSATAAAAAAGLPAVSTESTAVEDQASVPGLVPFTLLDTPSTTTTTATVEGKPVVDLMTCFDQWTSDLGNDEFAFNLTSVPVGSSPVAPTTTSSLGCIGLDPSPAALSVAASLTPLTGPLGMTPTPGTTALDVGDLADLADLTDLTDDAMTLCLGLEEEEDGEEEEDDEEEEEGGGDDALRMTRRRRRNNSMGRRMHHRGNINSGGGVVGHSQLFPMGFSMPHRFVSEDTTELDDSELDQLLYSEVGEDFSAYSHAFGYDLLGGGVDANDAAMAGGGESNGSLLAVGSSGGDLYNWYPTSVGMGLSTGMHRGGEPREPVNVVDTESLLPSSEAAFSALLSTDPILPPSSPGDLSQPLDLDLDFSLQLLSNSNSNNQGGLDGAAVVTLSSQPDEADGLEEGRLQMGSSLSRPSTPPLALDSTASTLSSGLSELSSGAALTLPLPLVSKDMGQQASGMMSKDGMYTPMALGDHHYHHHHHQQQQQQQQQPIGALVTGGGLDEQASMAGANARGLRTPTKRPLGKTTLSSPMPPVSSPTLSTAQMMMYLTGKVQYQAAPHNQQQQQQQQQSHRWGDAWGSELSDPGMAAGSEGLDGEDDEEEEGEEEEMDRGVGGYYGRPSRGFLSQEDGEEEEEDKENVCQQQQQQRAGQGKPFTSLAGRSMKTSYRAQPLSVAKPNKSNGSATSKGFYRRRDQGHGASGKMEYQSSRQYFDQLPA